MGRGLASWDLGGGPQRFVGSSKGGVVSDRVAHGASRWVVSRFGVQRPQFLSVARVWDTIGNAAWFVDRAVSRVAVCPSGTTGVAVQMAGLPAL